MADGSRERENKASGGGAARSSGGRGRSSGELFFAAAAARPAVRAAARGALNSAGWRRGSSAGLCPLRRGSGGRWKRAGLSPPSPPAPTRLPPPLPPAFPRLQWLSVCARVRARSHKGKEGRKEPCSVRAAAERPFRASLSFSSLPPARPRRPSAGVPRPSRRAEGPGGGRACPGRAGGAGGAARRSVAQNGSSRAALTSSARSPRHRGRSAPPRRSASPRAEGRGRRAAPSSEAARSVSPRAPINYPGGLSSLRALSPPPAALPGRPSAPAGTRPKWREGAF